MLIHGNMPPSFLRSLSMTPFTSLKMLLLSFLLGSVLLVLFACCFISNSQQRWILIALYTWSSAAFIIYKTFQLTKSIHHGPFKK